MNRPHTTNRRTFLRHAGAAAGAPFFVKNLISAPPSGTLRLASFGADGMAWVTLDQLARHPSVKLACVADVDSSHFNKVKAKYPEAKTYEDWRRLLESEHKAIDIVCVATPDHMHAPASLAA